jgi:hypothetical protein
MGEKKNNLSGYSFFVIVMIFHLLKNCHDQEKRCDEICKGDPVCKQSNKACDG